MSFPVTLAGCDVGLIEGRDTFGKVAVSEATGKAEVSSPMIQHPPPKRQEVVLPPFSSRTLHHPSFQSLYMAVGSMQCSWRARNRGQMGFPVPAMIPSDFFYSDPSLAPGRRLPNDVTQLEVFECCRLNTPRPIMSVRPALLVGPDPFRMEHLTRNLGSREWAWNPQLPPRTHGCRVEVIELSLEEDEAITNLLRLRYDSSQGTPCSDPLDMRAMVNTDSSCQPVCAVTECSPASSEGFTDDLQCAPVFPSMTDDLQQCAPVFPFMTDDLQCAPVFPSMTDDLQQCAPVFPFMTDDLQCAPVFPSMTGDLQQCAPVFPSMTDDLQCAPVFPSMTDDLQQCAPVFPSMTDDLQQCAPVFPSMTDDLQCAPVFPFMTDDLQCATVFPSMTDDLQQCAPVFPFMTDDLQQCAPVFPSMTGDLQQCAPVFPSMTGDLQCAPVFPSMTDDLQCAPVFPSMTGDLQCAPVFPSMTGDLQCAPVFPSMTDDLQQCAPVFPSMTGDLQCAPVFLSMTDDLQQCAPVFPSMTDDLQQCAPVFPSMTGDLQQCAPVFPSMTGDLQQCAPVFPSMTGDLQQCAPVFLSMTDCQSSQRSDVELDTANILLTLEDVVAGGNEGETWSRNWERDRHLPDEWNVFPSKGQEPLAREAALTHMGGSCPNPSQQGFSQADGLALRSKRERRGALTDEGRQQRGPTGRPETRA